MKKILMTLALCAAGALSAPAMAAGCEAVVESNDAMQFNVKSIDVPKSCKKFSVTLKHVGKMPKTAMGHNLVVTTAADMLQGHAEALAGLGYGDALGVELHHVVGFDRGGAVGGKSRSCSGGAKSQGSEKFLHDPNPFRKSMSRHRTAAWIAVQGTNLVQTLV